MSPLLTIGEGAGEMIPDLFVVIALILFLVLGELSAAQLRKERNQPRLAYLYSSTKIVILPLLFIFGMMFIGKIHGSL